MSMYGEPWHIDPDDDLLVAVCREDGFCAAPDGGDKRTAQRIVACVNALAGIPNPEAVQELIRVCRELRDADPNDIWTPGAGYILAICYAVEKLEAPSAGAQQK